MTGESDVLAPRFRIERLAAPTEVGARTERLARARHHDRAHVVVAVGLAKDVDHLFEHRVGKRVHAVGAVEGEDADAAVLLVFRVLAFHEFP